jgi:hypothetical protein
VTAREPSAVEVIAEAVPHHEGCIDWTPEDDFFCWCKGYRREVAEAVLAAIRAMTVEQQAELIGGEVETYRWHPGSQGVFVSTPRVRVRGPWREVQP